VKNHTFKEFWESVDTIVEQQRNQTTAYTQQELQEHIERQVYGEDERQAIRMQEMMQQM
jgi:hypothetical protein